MGTPGLQVKTSGPRSAFEVTYAVDQDDVTDAFGAVEVAADMAIRATTLVVSETVRVVADRLADGCWYWMVTLRVFPRGTS